MSKTKVKTSVIAAILAVIMAVSFAGCKKDPAPTPGGQNSITLNKSSVTLQVGTSETLTATTVPADAKVTWSSNNENVAKISGGGSLLAVSVGSAVITATNGDKSATCAVTVTEDAPVFDPVVDGEVKFSYLPDLQKLETLDVVSYDFGNNKHSQQGTEIFGELVTLSVMQGLLARTEGEKRGIYLNVIEGGISADSSTTWLDEIKLMGDVTSAEINDTQAASAFSQILTKYKDTVTKKDGKPGYVLFEQSISDMTDPDGNPIQVGRQNVNAACTIASATGFLPIDKTCVALAESLGYTLAVDACNMTEIAAYNEYKDKLSKDIIMLTNNGQAQNRDFGIAAGAFFMYESNKDNSFMNEITDPTNGQYKQGTLTIGWSSTGEVSQVNRHALYGFNFTCTNYSYNLSVSARLGKKSFVQKAQDEKITADPTKKYVSFIMTDGDNVTWHQNDFPFSEGWYGYSKRGDFKMGWTMAPIMADLAPQIIAKEYKMATAKDQFVCGVSGSGYIYPSEYGSLQPDSLAKLVESTNEYMRRTDLDYVEILDNTVFDTNVMNAYASQSDIDGGFVLANYNYYKQGGDLKYYNGKPFLGIGEAMWSDSAGRVAHRLNSLPVDITSVNGYTAVKVHCWSTAMADVANMVSKLDDNIVIVSPGELMQLVKDNVKTDSKRTATPNTNYPADVDEYVEPQYFWDNTAVSSKAEFNFDTYKDYDGWKKFIGSRSYDYVSFSGETWKYGGGVRTTVDGGNGYSIRMDGSDYGVEDDTPNASIYNKLLVPDSPNARFSFFARGEGYGYDATYRVRVISKKDGKPILEKLDKAWIELGDDKWREITYDVSAYAGKEVIFIIEHNSTSKEGDGEIIYVDNIRVGVETLDINVVNKGTTNANSTFDFTSGLMNFKTIGSVAHNADKGAVEVALGASPAADNGADAVIYTKFDLKNYTGFTHTKFGIWANAETGKTAQVRLAAISADKKQILRFGTWTTVSDTATYFSMDLDTIRLIGGGFSYAQIIVEVRSSGVASKLYLDNANFGLVTRNFSNGYYYDAQYLQNIKTSQISGLNNVNEWNLQVGRGIEDEAKIEDGKVRLFGYDYMKNDSAVSSKSLANFAKVDNEYNGRMFARVNIESTANFKFSAQRIEKTLQGQNAVVPQLRVTFIEDNGTVTILKDWTKINDYSEQAFTVSLAAVQNKTGAIMLEMDCSQNGDRSGATISKLSFN